ncbi:glutathione S-transferase [Xylariaceae sp. FL0016]|nr:glutathione S-transferase [Xylariaceae sp. FL0016]
MALPIRVWLTRQSLQPRLHVFESPLTDRCQVLFVLEELEVPYEARSIKFDDAKKAPSVGGSPHGRVLAIEDPNVDLTLWESGAMLTYIIERYDTRNALTYTDLEKKHHLNQWLHFQTSGQGPYYGIAGWFIHLHPEKVQSAIERYTNQVTRVLCVLEGCLEGKEWLVGDKMTYVDMAWVPWNDRVDTSLGIPESDKFKGFPNVKAWHERMVSLPSWEKTIQLKAKLVNKQGIIWLEIDPRTTSKLLSRRRSSSAR